MIDQIAIAGYRSIRSIILRLGQLNAVTCANGSGKSNVYRALKLIADAAAGRLGILEWKDPKLSGFPKENRQDAEFVKVLKDRGVPENQIQVIEDRNATAERIVDQFQRFVVRPANGDTLTR